jgi:enoyl-CoA hydratase
MAYETILVETRGRVGLVTLNRPKALNALNQALLAELIAALDAFDADSAIGCIVLLSVGAWAVFRRKEL